MRYDSAQAGCGKSRTQGATSPLFTANSRSNSKHSKVIIVRKPSGRHNGCPARPWKVRLDKLPHQARGAAVDRHNPNTRTARGKTLRSAIDYIYDQATFDAMALTLQHKQINTARTQGEQMHNPTIIMSHTAINDTTESSPLPG